MKDTYISDSIVYVGVDDTTIDLFESQYVVPEGVSYNSYIIFDEKIAVMDTVDPRGTEEWLANVKKALDGKSPDYLVVQHLEPDHAGSIKALTGLYPDMKLVGNAKTFPMIHQFFEIDLPDEKMVVVKEGDTLSLGTHTLQFFMAPMVHWPEVMVTYEQSSKILFSADGFGTFGALSSDEEWLCEARRYYINIVGKYGAQVQALLKKASTLDIQMICPLHGPILKEDLGFYIGKYLTWSSYEPEEDGVVIACASIHGNTAKAAKQFAEILNQKGAKNVVFFDLARDDMAAAIENAYRYDKLVLAAASYDGGVFPCMEDFLNHLRSKNFQKRKVAYIQNGSWAPSAGKVMQSLISQMKNITEIEPMVTVRSTVKPETIAQMEALADALLA
ncbi:MAG TPA: FprA family A-type flavoprotein [Candidatus Choladousia intestinipullorum]|nr:FprA family A-type flavoprotein [Candidatus Choladousia intestinipullorum]